MTNICLVLTTCGSDATARAMAQDLVDCGLAASVSLQPVHTYFRFDGQTLEETEVQLLVLTTIERYGEIEERILRLHTYEVPDVVMIHADACSMAASTWISSSTRPKS